MKGLPVKEDELAAKVGYKIKELYGSDVKKTTNGVAEYKLKLKTVEDVEKEFKHIWLTNEDNLTENQVDILNKLTGDVRVIFTAIKKGEYNTINKLHNQYPTITVLKHVKTLERLGLICNTFTDRLI